jgi:glycerophosphoryl diester phosphodiesterase
VTGEARPLVIAHRGDARRAPENTIAALLAALAVAGCDGLEFDLRLSADGEAVLLHDETLVRVFGRRERPGELVAGELAAIGVPSLADVLAVVPPQAFLDVELKEDLGEAAVRPLRAARGLPDGGLSRAVVSAFDPVALVTVRRLAPAWPTWLNTLDLSEATLAVARAAGCTGVAAEHRSIDAGSVARVRAAGLDPAAWTVNNAGELKRLAGLGVVAVCVEADLLDG